jgi:hypothetical protein
MKHTSTRELFDYWTLRRGRRVVPDRADIEPGPIRHVLADTFILAFDARAGHPFRIAGTRVCALFGRELKGEGFLGLWSAESQGLLRDLLTVVTHEAVGVVASASGTAAAGAIHELELLLLPLGHRGRTDVRVLGALAPRDTAHWLGSAALSELTLGTLRYLGSGTGADTPTAPVRPQGRIRHGFMVYDGGQC